MDDSKEADNEGGISITPTSFNCLPCKCGKKLYHKTTTHTKEDNKHTIVIVEDRSSWKVGRNTTPSDNVIFRPDQNGSVAICDTGWGAGRKPTPEECDERLEKNADDIKELRMDIERKTYKTSEDFKELKENIKQRIERSEDEIKRIKEDIKRLDENLDIRKIELHLLD